MKSSTESGWIVVKKRGGKAARASTAAPPTSCTTTRPDENTLKIGDLSSFPCLSGLSSGGMPTNKSWPAVLDSIPDLTNAGRDLELGLQRSEDDDTSCDESKAAPFRLSCVVVDIPTGDDPSGAGPTLSANADASTTTTVAGADAIVKTDTDTDATSTSTTIAGDVVEFKPDATRSTIATTTVAGTDAIVKTDTDTDATSTSTTVAGPTPTTVAGPTLSANTDATSSPTTTTVAVTDTIAKPDANANGCTNTTVAGPTLSADADTSPTLDALSASCLSYTDLESGTAGDVSSENALLAMMHGSHELQIALNLGGADLKRHLKRAGYGNNRLVPLLYAIDTRVPLVSEKVTEFSKRGGKYIKELRRQLGVLDRLTLDVMIIRGLLAVDEDELGPDDLSSLELQDDIDQDIADGDFPLVQLALAIEENYPDPNDRTAAMAAVVAKYHHLSFEANYACRRKPPSLPYLVASASVALLLVLGLSLLYYSFVVADEGGASSRRLISTGSVDESNDDQNGALSFIVGLLVVVVAIVGAGSATKDQYKKTGRGGSVLPSKTKNELAVGLEAVDALVIDLTNSDSEGEGAFDGEAIETIISDGSEVSDGSEGEVVVVGSSENECGNKRKTVTIRQGDIRSFFGASGPKKGKYKGGGSKENEDPASFASAAAASAPVVPAQSPAANRPTRSRPTRSSSGSAASSTAQSAAGNNKHSAGHEAAAASSLNCPVCDKLYKKPKSLQNHISKEHPDSTTNSSLNPLTSASALKTLSSCCGKSVRDVEDRQALLFCKSCGGTFHKACCSDEDVVENEHYQCRFCRDPSSEEYSVSYTNVKSALSGRIDVRHEEGKKTTAYERLVGLFVYFQCNLSRDQKNCLLTTMKYVAVAHNKASRGGQLVFGKCAAETAIALEFSFGELRSKDLFRGQNAVVREQSAITDAHECWGITGYNPYETKAIIKKIRSRVRDVSVGIVHKDVSAAHGGCGVVGGMHSSNPSERRDDINERRRRIRDEKAKLSADAFAAHAFSSSDDDVYHEAVESSTGGVVPEDKLYKCFDSFRDPEINEYHGYNTPSALRHISIIRPDHLLAPPGKPRMYLYPSSDVEIGSDNYLWAGPTTQGAIKFGESHYSYVTDLRSGRLPAIFLYMIAPFNPDYHKFSQNRLKNGKIPYGGNGGIAFFGKSPDEVFPNRCDMLYLDAEGNEKWVVLYSERKVPEDVESLAKEVEKKIDSILPERFDKDQDLKKLKERVKVTDKIKADDKERARARRKADVIDGVYNGRDESYCDEV